MIGLPLAASANLVLTRLLIEGSVPLLLAVLLLPWTYLFAKAVRTYREDRRTYLEHQPTSPSDGESAP